jgi:hypothetical protein
VRPWAETLRDPGFWEQFFDDLPSPFAGDAEEQALAEVASRADKPLAYVRDCMHTYLRIQIGKLYNLHPGTDAIN